MSLFIPLGNGLISSFNFAIILCKTDKITLWKIVQPINLIMQLKPFL